MIKRVGKLLAILIIGLVVGYAFGSYLTSQDQQQHTGNVSTSQGKGHSFTTTATLTEVYVSTLTRIEETTVTTFSPDYYQLASALNNSANAKLNVTSYDFLNSALLKDLLIVQLENIGNGPILVSPQDCLLNGSFFNEVAIVPATQRVVYGEFYYIAPGWSFDVSIKLPFTPSLRDNSTLQIFNNSWAFMFGTASA
ncbi:MAG TPA: hypothetical protein VFF30_03510 [Nitrososphaerales archaeon]|nr:hypothetical protein [Nitrososphaerales archaeon]